MEEETTTTTTAVPQALDYASMGVTEEEFSNMSVEDQEALAADVTAAADAEEKKEKAVAAAKAKKAKSVPVDAITAPVSQDHLESARSEALVNDAPHAAERVLSDDTDARAQDVENAKVQAMAQSAPESHPVPEKVESAS